MHGECVSISCRNRERERERGRERERERERERDRRNDREERKTYYDDNENSGCLYALVRTLVSFSLYRLLTQFLAFLRSFLSLYFTSYAQFLQPTTSLRPLLLPLLLFFYFRRRRRRRRRRRFVLFAFCLFSRLRTGSLHSRAPRVEGPRQGKPVSRVRA